MVRASVGNKIPRGGMVHDSRRREMVLIWMIPRWIFPHDDWRGWSKKWHGDSSKPWIDGPWLPNESSVLIGEMIGFRENPDGKSHLEMDDL